MAEWRHRIEFVKQMYGRPLLRLALLMYGLFAFVQWAVGEFGSPWLISRVRLGNNIPDLTIWQWLCIGFVLLLVTGFEGAFRLTRQQQEGLLEQASGIPLVPKLEVVFGEGPEFRWSDRDDVAEYRFGVRNLGSSAVHHARVTLTRIDPTPRNYFPGRYPYSVIRTSTEQPDPDGCSIGPGATELYSFLGTWHNGPIRTVGNLDTSEARGWPFVVEDDEVFVLTYTVSSDETEPIEARFELKPDRLLAKPHLLSPSPVS